jgi:hypothetical protein
VQKLFVGIVTVLKYVNITELKQLVLNVKEVQYVNIIKEEYIV